MSHEQADLTIIVPVYNEASNITRLYDELSQALDNLARSYEVIVIDDGSTDDSFDRLKAIHATDQRWQIIQFRRNFGQTAAFSAGFDAASGKTIITIDADLQNDPNDIPKLLAKFDEGYDIVSGWRVDRKEPFFSRRLPSIIANWLISRLTGVMLHDYGCSLKAYDRAVVDHLQLYGDLHRFIPAVASWYGVRVTEVPVNDRARLHGSSKYGIGRTFKVIVDLVTVGFMLEFGTRPSHAFGFVGFILSFVGFVIAAYLSSIKLFLGESIGNRPLLLMAVLLLVVGIQMITLGLLAEMQMRTYYEVQNKPIYAIREHLKTADDDADNPA